MACGQATESDVRGYIVTSVCNYTTFNNVVGLAVQCIKKYTNMAHMCH